MLRAVLILILLLPSLAAAQVRYSAAELQRVRDRALPSIRNVFIEDIVGNMPREMRARGAAISLAFPEEGRHPLDFYARPDTQTIYMPLTSIRFFDDVATLIAWFQGKGCRQEYVQSYLQALLKQGQPLPSPLVAFGIDRNVALADPYTDSLSLKIMSSGLQFILAHEVGHLMLDHRTDVTYAHSQAQETEADAFALDHFSRLGGSPMGVFFYYLAAFWSDPVREQRATSSHPVSPERLRALGSRLLAEPMAFAHAEADPQFEAGLVRDLGGMVMGFANQIDDDDWLTLMPALLDRDFPPSRYAGACPG